jgi:hypothetical protein
VVKINTQTPAQRGSARMRRGLETVHDGHPDVHQDDIGLGLDDEVDGVRSVGGAVDDVEVGGRIEEYAESGPQQGLVVDHGHADHRACVPGPTGSSTQSRDPVRQRLGFQRAAEERGPLADAAEAVARPGRTNPLH